MIEPLEVILRGLAAFYLSEAFVTSVKAFVKRVWPVVEHQIQGGEQHPIYVTEPNPSTSKFKRILEGKPFNCDFCMVFWIGLIMWFIPMSPVITIPAIAGVAALLAKLAHRLETIII